MKRSFFLLIVFIILVSACGPSADIARSSLRRETKPQVPDANLKALVAGNNTFALDLYKSLRTDEGNLIISPYSVSIAFAMTYAGARRETASQIASTFHFDLPADQLHSAFDALDLALAKHAKVKVPKDKDPIQLNIANSIWAQKSLAFQTPFLDTLGANYGAGVRRVDFSGNPNAARKAVNSWADDATKGKIKDIVPEEGFSPDTRMVLINAVYFNANWLMPFEFTQAAPFHLLGGSQITVPTMSLEGTSFPYASDGNWFAIELPYAGETFAMDIIVPNAGEFKEFETGLNTQFVSGILSSLEGTDVDLTLPKFTFTNDFSLAEDLKRLGVLDAFSADADFSSMTGNRDLYLDETLHKTYVAVDEDGTTAAAVTENEFMLISGTLPAFPVHIDRPFIFIIRDVETGQFLFIGRVLDPR